MVVEQLKDYDPDIRQAALKSLSGLAAQGMHSPFHSVHFVAHWHWFVVEFQQEIRLAIPMVVELLKDSHRDVRRAALGSISGLGAQGMDLLQSEHFVAC